MALAIQLCLLALLHVNLVRSIVPPASSLAIEPNRTMASQEIDEAARERAAIKRIQERKREREEYDAVEKAQAAAEKSRKNSVVMLDTLHEWESAEREKRETILKASIDAAFEKTASSLGLVGMRTYPDDTTQDEKDAIARARERTREEMEYSAIDAALSTAERGREAEMKEVEKGRKNEVEGREDTEETFKNELDAAMKISKN